jgi:hypothetical protein
MWAFLARFKLEGNADQAMKLFAYIVVFIIKYSDVLLVLSMGKSYSQHRDADRVLTECLPLGLIWNTRPGRHSMGLSMGCLGCDAAGIMG